MKNVKIIVDSISKSTYENETCWVQYCEEIVDKKDVVRSKVGYILTDNVTEDTDKKILEDLINKDETLLKRCLEKPYYKDVCSEYLSGLIIECLQSENEMWYVDYEDMEELEVTQETLDYLRIEVEKLGLSAHITVDDGEYAVCVYGLVITKFLF